MGRPAHADDLGLAAPWLHAGGDPRFLRAHRRRQKAYVIDMAQLEHASRRSQSPRAARDGRPEPLKVVLTNYPRAGRRGRRLNYPEDPSAGTGKCRSRASSTSSTTISWRTRRRSSSASRRAGKCGSVRLLHHVHRGRQGRARRDRGAPLHVRSRDARRRRARRPEGEGHHPLGVGAARGRRRGAALRPAVLRETRTRPEGKTFLDHLNPHSLEVLRGCRRSRVRAGDRRHRFSSSGSATSVSIPIRARRARVQSHRVAARHLGADLGQGRGQGREVATRTTANQAGVRLPGARRGVSSCFRDGIC